MTCTLTKRIAAIMLSVAMVFTMMPWLGGVAYAAGEQGPLITVTTGAELKAVLESTDAADNGATIQVNADGIKLSSSITVKNKKVLNLDGHQVDFSGYTIYVKERNCDFTVGGGSIVGTGTIFDVGGEANMTVKDGTYTCHDSSNYNFWVNAGTGTLTINGGWFQNDGYGQVFHSQTSASNSAYNIVINDGVFYSSKGSGNNVVWGAPASDVTDVTINGGTFYANGNYVFSFYDACPNKRVGDGKVCYRNGVTYNNTDLALNSISSNYFVQVGAASDFVDIEVLNTNGGRGYLGVTPSGSVSTLRTTGHFLKNANIPLKVYDDGTTTFVGWELGTATGSFDNSAAATTWFKPQSAGTIQANFNTKTKYEITKNVTGGSSSLTGIRVNSVAISAPYKACEGQEIRVTCTESSSSVAFKSMRVEDAEGNPIPLKMTGYYIATFTMPDGPVSVYTEYANPYSIKVQTPENGIVSKVSLENGRTLSSTAIYTYEGDTVNVETIADPEYRLGQLYYLEDGSSVKHNITDGKFTMPAANVQIVAEFEEIPEYSISVVPSEHGKVTPDIDKAKPGTKVTLAVNPDKGYALKSLQVLCGIDEIPVAADGSFIMPEGKVQIFAEFENAPYYPIVKEYEVIDSKGDISSAKGGTLECVSSYYDGGEVKVNAIPADGYYVDFIKVFDGDDNELCDLENGESFTMQAPKVTVLVVFREYKKIKVATGAELKAALELDSPAIITPADGITAIELTDGYVDVKNTKFLDMGNVIVHSTDDVAFEARAENCDFRIISGNYIAEDTLLLCGGKANVTIESGEFIGKTPGNSALITDFSGTGTLTINGGRFEAAGNYQVFHTQIEAGREGYHIVINDGVFLADAKTMESRIWGSPAYDITDVTINGGTFFASGLDSVMSFYDTCPDKRVGDGKWCYIDGVRYTGQYLNSKVCRTGHFLQVGAASDFMNVNAYGDGNGSAFFAIGEKQDAVEAKALRNRPIFVKSVADDGYNFGNYSCNKGAVALGTLGDYDEFVPSAEGASITANFGKGVNPIFAEGNPARIAGASRYETSIKLADAYKDAIGVGKDGKVDNVVVAYGGNYPDALAGGYVATEKNATLITVDTNAASEGVVYNWIKDNMKSGGTVYILGGTGVVRPEFENKLKNNGVDIVRYSGASRFDTNMDVLNKVGVHGELLLCSAYGYADSLGASATGKPIMLVGPNLTADQKKFIKDKGISKITIIGGTGAISATVEKEAKSLCGNVERAYGANRYDTSIEVAKAFTPSFDTVVTVYGQNFPDGLSAGPVAYALNAPLLLATSDVYKPQATFVKTNGKAGGSYLIVVGGPTLISNAAAKTIAGV